MEAFKDQRHLFFQKQITDCDHQEEIIKSTKNILKNQFKLEDIKVISCGIYSHVLAAVKEDSDAVAVKVIPRKRRTDGITKIWPYVRHKNILPVLYTEFIAGLDAFLALSPLHVCTLEYVLKLKEFMVSGTAVQLIQNWIREIASALDYLHKRKLCHLGLKLQNILIASDNTAVICDFRVAEVSIIPIDVHDVMPCDMAPEMIERLNIFPRIHMEGIPFDIWSFGMLALNIFTDKYVQEKCHEEAPFWHTIYPFIFKVIQPTYFNNFIKVYLPACDVSEELSEIILNFITACLIIHPDRRYSAEKLMKHRFLKEKGFMHKPDELWERLVPSDAIQRMVHTYLPQKSCVALPAATSSNLYDRTQLCCDGFQNTSGVSDEGIIMKSDSALSVKKTCREKHEAFIESQEVEKEEEEEAEEKLTRPRFILPLLQTVPEIDLGLPENGKSKSHSSTNLPDIDLVFARAFNRLDNCFKDLFVDVREVSSCNDIHCLLKDATVIEERTQPEHEDQCPFQSYNIDSFSKSGESENYAEMVFCMANARVKNKAHETNSLPIELVDKTSDANAFSVFLSSKDGEKYRERILEDLQKLHVWNVEDKVMHADLKGSRSEEGLKSKSFFKQTVSDPLVHRLAVKQFRNDSGKRHVIKNQPDEYVEDISCQSTSGTKDEGVCSGLLHPSEESNNGQKNKNTKCHLS